MVASEIRVWEGIRHGRSLPLPGCVFEQQGKEAAKAVLGVGSGLGDDPDHPELGSVPFGPLSPLLSVLMSFISLCLIGPVVVRI